MLSKFSEAIRTNLTKNQRLKIVSLVTIEVHSRDIIEHLTKSGCSDAASFEWLKELRFRVITEISWPTYFLFCKHERVTLFRSRGLGRVSVNVCKVKFTCL